MGKGFNLSQLFEVWDAAAELHLFTSDIRGSSELSWFNENFGGIDFSIDAPITQWLNSSVTPDDGHISLIQNFEKIKWEQGVTGHVIHEVGHVLDNRVGLRSLNSTGRLSVFSGGGPADALYGFMGGSNLQIPRFSGGVTFSDNSSNFPMKYDYGNNSSADYFSHTLALSITDPQGVPNSASSWMSAFIYMLP